MLNNKVGCWRNGSAFDSRSKGYLFKSGVAHFRFLGSSELFAGSDLGKCVQGRKRQTSSAPGSCGTVALGLGLGLSMSSSIVQSTLINPTKTVSPASPGHRSAKLLYTFEPQRLQSPSH